MVHQIALISGMRAPREDSRTAESWQVFPTGCSRRLCWHPTTPSHHQRQAQPPAQASPSELSIRLQALRKEVTDYCAPKTSEYTWKLWPGSTHWVVSTRTLKLQYHHENLGVSYLKAAHGYKCWACTVATRPPKHSCKLTETAKLPFMIIKKPKKPNQI